MHAADTDTTVAARLCAGGVETPYERSGRGPALVLLVRSLRGRSSHGALIAGLSESFRVFRPRLVTSVWGSVEAAPAPPERWLRDFVEGVGLDRPIVVVESWAALRLRSLRSDDRFRAWIEIPDELGEPAAGRVLREVIASSG